MRLFFKVTPRENWAYNKFKSNYISPRSLSLFFLDFDPVSFKDLIASILDVSPPTTIKPIIPKAAWGEH